MPPQKQEVKEVQPILGRASNSLRMGIVGLPNVGKSSTFNLLSKLNVPAENYPFCTIDPNIAKVAVPDERFNKLCEIWKPKSQISSTLSIIDIAGLVPGASKGEGLGNKFLSHIKETDGIFHVVRAFDNPQVTHTENEVDPVRDMQIISTELVLKDLEFCSNRIDEIRAKIAKQNAQEQKEELATLEQVLALLETGKWVRTGDWTNIDIEYLNKHMFITAKETIYLINLSEEDFLKKKNQFLGKIKEWIDTNCPGGIIPYSVEYEKKVVEDMLKKEAETKETPLPPPNSMLSQIITTGFQCLQLIYFFTAGADQVRCWTIRDGTKAPQAAGVIHTDFEKGFICAEIMKYDDFIQYGTETAVKAEGKYHQKGQDYVVEDGDIIFFKFNVGSSKKQ